MPDTSPPENFVEYMNKPEVLSSLGAYLGFARNDYQVGFAFSMTGDDDRNIGAVSE